MTSIFTFKRGDTFTAVVRYTPPEGGIQNFTGFTVTSKIADSRGTRFALDCTLSGDGLYATVIGTSAVTKDFAIGQARWDVRFEQNGVVIHTGTAYFSVEDQVTTSD